MRDILKNGTHFLFRRQTNILSAAFVIMTTYGISHLFGLVKTRLLVSYFFGGRAPLLDVYYAALVVPDTIFQLLIIGALSAAFIPTFTRYLARDESEAWKMASATLNAVGLIFVAVCLPVLLLATPLSKLIAPGFSAGQIATMAALLKIMLVAQLFFAVSGFLTATLQSHQRFLIPALAPVVYNLGIIAGILFLSPTVGIYGPAWGMVAGAALHMLVQLPLAYRLGFRFSARIDLGHPGVREIAKLIPLRSLALGIDQIEQFVAVVLASTLAAGSLSLFNVARLLYAIPALLFGSTIGQAALPTLSRVAARRDDGVFRQTLFDSILQVVFLALPTSVLFIVLRIPIVRIVFGAKTFPWTATLLTGKTLAILSASAAFYALMQLAVRGFYALHDTKTPLAVGLTAAVFNTGLSLVAVLWWQWGILGIAGAVSVTAVVETIVLLWLLVNRLGGGPSAIVPPLKTLLKMVAISLVTGVSLWVPMRLLDRFIFDTTRTVPLIALTLITAVTGLAVYLGLSFWFKVEQLTTFVQLVKKLRRFREVWTATSEEPLIVPAPDQN